MDTKEYVEGVLCTEAPIDSEVCRRVSDVSLLRLLHSSMGLCTEAGEFMDILKKYIYYGKQLDVANMLEEIGDHLWYVAIAIDEMRTTFSDVMQLNNDKLKLRYKGGFSDNDALNRDLESEKELLDASIKGR